MDRFDYKHNSRGYIADSALDYFVSILVTGVFLSALLKHIGVPDDLNGIISAMTSLACVAQLFSGMLIKSNRSVKKTMTAITMITNLMKGCIYIVPFLPVSRGIAVAVTVALVLGSYIAENLCSPVKHQWMLAVSVVPTRRGHLSAVNEIVSLITGIIYTFAMSSLMDTFEAQNKKQLGFIVFGSIIFIICVIRFLILNRLQDTEIESSGAGFTGLGRQFKSASVKKLLFMFILWRVANGLSTSFFGTYLIGELDFSLTTVSVFSLVYAAVRSVFSPWLGKYADEKGYHKLLHLCFFLCVIAFGVNSFTRPGRGWLYVVYYALYAIGMGGINSGLYNIIYEYVDDSEYAATMGICNCVSGVLGFGASLLGGVFVNLIQKNGNTFLGMNVYAQQVLSFGTFLILLLLVLYMGLVIAKMPRTDKK